MSSPPPKSSVPATMPTVWPPSNPSGTVIPFPLPWGQTGCCPPGGMDALMKCYCDIQQASAFIGQIMLDQINNNPAIIAAIIAGIEQSGSSLPLLGVTNGVAAQPGQVGEFVQFIQTVNVASGNNTQSVTMGVLQPGDWDCWFNVYFPVALSGLNIDLIPPPPGFSGNIGTAFYGGTGEVGTATSTTVQGLISVPSLIVFSVNTEASTAGTMYLTFCSRRMR